MVYSAAQQVSTATPTTNATTTPEAQQLISRLREIGVKVVAGNLHPPSTSTAGNPTATHVNMSPNEDGTMSFACGACSEFNTINIARETFYVVTAGTSVGIFRDSALADSFVTGIKCSVRKKYSTLEAALGAFQAALGLDTVKLLLKD